jgi:hypothetical protein
VLNTTGEYIVMFGLAYGNDTGRTRCTFQSQNSRQTFANLSRSLRKGGICTHSLRTRKTKGESGHMIQSTESGVTLLNNLGATHKGPQLQNMLPN